MSNERYSRTKKATRRATFILIALFTILFAWIIISLIRKNPESEVADIETDIQPTQTEVYVEPTPEPTNTPLFPTATSGPQVILVTATPSANKVSEIPGMMVFSISEAGYYHLFAFHPELLPLTRLTNGTWDDKDPAISPDGKQIAYSSHRDGQWDIFTLDLETGIITKITDDKHYDGAPAWGPQGKWIAYESYNDGNLDIYLKTVDLSMEALRVTYDRAEDTSPTWHINGTLIAFTSNRTGDEDIWLADISSFDGQDYLVPFTSGAGNQNNPAWSTDGSYFTWISDQLGENKIMLSTMELGEDSALIIGSGNLVRWNPDGGQLLVNQKVENIDYVAAINTTETQANYLMLPIALEGVLGGMDWNHMSNPESWFEQTKDVNAKLFNDKYSLASAQPNSNSPALLQVNDLLAPNASLNSNAKNSFVELWDRASIELGWDILSDLDEAYTPLYISPDPGLQIDWSYTGCSIELVSTLHDLGWLEIVREDKNGQIFWRVYAKAYVQDGSLGEPMQQFPWDFSAQYSFEGAAYDEGGALAPDIPEGYWVDFTELAFSYGWDRLPAAPSWRTFSPATRWNEFVFSSGLDWESAMLMIYTEEELDDWLGN